MLWILRMLAWYGAIGRPECVTISFKRRECLCSYGVVKRVSIAAISGSAVSREDRGEIISYCRRVPDKAIADRCAASARFPSRPARCATCARPRGRRHGAQCKDSGAHRQGGAPLRRRVDDEGELRWLRSRLRRQGHNHTGGRDGGVLAGNFPVPGACTKRLVYFRFRGSRSKTTLSETYCKFLHVPATADNYAGLSCKKHQNDLIHRIRGAKFVVFRTTKRPTRGPQGRRRRVRHHAQGVGVGPREHGADHGLAYCTGRPAAHRQGSPIPEPDAPSPDPLPDGNDRRRGAGAVRATGGAIDDDEAEAETLQGEVKSYSNVKKFLQKVFGVKTIPRFDSRDKINTCRIAPTVRSQKFLTVLHLQLHFLYLSVRRRDTTSESAVVELRDLVGAEIHRCMATSTRSGRPPPTRCPACSLRCPSPACRSTATA